MRSTLSEGKEVHGYASALTHRALRVTCTFPNPILIFLNEDLNEVTPKQQ